MKTFVICTGQKKKRGHKTNPQKKEKGKRKGKRDCDFELLTSPVNMADFTV